MMRTLLKREVVSKLFFSDFHERGNLSFLEFFGHFGEKIIEKFFWELS